MKLIGSLGRAAVVLTLSLMISYPASARAVEKSDAAPIRVGLIKITIQGAVFAAEKLGYFKEEGLKIEPVLVQNGAAGLAALAGDSLEFTGCPSTSFLMGRQEGFPFVAVADGARGPDSPPGPIAMLARNDGSINTPKDLEGKIIGTGSRKTTAELHFVFWAKKHGLDPDKVRYIEMPVPSLQDALISKQVDAIVTLEPFVTRALDDKKIKVIGYPDVEMEPGYSSALWIGREGWIKDHPIATEKFVRSIYRANEYLTKHLDQRIKLMAEWTGLSEDLLKRTAPDVLYTGLPTESLQRQFILMKTLGWIRPDFNFNEVEKALWTRP